MKTITFAIDGRDGRTERAIAIDTLVIACWTGRDTVAMEKHIRELEELGVKRPATTPVFYRVAADRRSVARDPGIGRAEQRRSGIRAAARRRRDLRRHRVRPYRP